MNKLKQTFKYLSYLFLLSILFNTSSCEESIKMSANNFQNIQTGFVIPDEANNVWCYWYWINDDISKEGITKDLEAMKSVGIGTAFIGNINPKEVDGPVPMLSEAWWECMVHAVNEGKRIGVDIGTFNCPGWSMSGGPWVESDIAMRHLVYSEADIRGPKNISLQLLKPKDEFQDTQVLAFPRLKSEKIKLSNVNSIVKVSPTIKNESNLIDGDLSTVTLFKPSIAAYTFNFKSDHSIIARSIRIFPGEIGFNAEFELFAYINGGFKSVKTFLFERSNSSVNVGPDIHGPVSISLPETYSNSFKLVCKNKGRKWKTGAGLSEIIISEGQILESYVEKKLGKMFPSPLPKWDSYLWKDQEKFDDTTLQINSNEIIDLSSKMDKDGVLTWDVPDGEWTVIRFGMTPTGTKNSPSAPQGKGYEIDKASRKIARYHYENYVGELMKRIPKENRSAFKYVIADSYEQGSQNWTDDFEKKFESRFGYNPVNYLPVFTGKVVNSVEESNRFLWDLRRSIADAVAYEYVGGLREISNENNLQLWLENYGHWGFPSEFLMYGGQSNLVAGEFWNEGSLGNIECKSGSSAAHIYGKPITSAEAFTAAGKAYQRHPAMLKKRGDWSFTEGINHFVLHLYIHQPDDNRIPGVNAWFSTEFNRHNTWFKQSKSWIEYIRRSQHLLQQGKYVADVCYFIGEDAPMMTGARNPELPEGYSYDYINAEVIKERLSVKDGKFILPDGTSYSLMILPPIKTMRPELLKKIESLVAEGGVIFGQAPERSPSLANYPECDTDVKYLADKLWSSDIEKETLLKKYGKGYIIDNLDLKTTLRTIDIAEDVVFDKDIDVLWTHRNLKGMEIYFLTNQSDKEVNFTASFRVEKMKPQLWDAMTGEIRLLNEYLEKDGRISVPLKMLKDQSWFVVFTNNSRHVEKAYKKNFPELNTIHTINEKWTVDFQNKDIGPKSPVTFNSLMDWTLSNDEKIKFYSGNTIYKTSFEFTDVIKNKEYFINLGAVGVMAKVKLNGFDLGTSWMAPYRLKATGHLNKGINKVEIEVVNLWRNQLIKDKKLPKEERYTWHLVDDIKEGEKLQTSGLIGPVSIESLLFENSLKN